MSRIWIKKSTKIIVLSRTHSLNSSFTDSPVMSLGDAIKNNEFSTYNGTIIVSARLAPEEFEKLNSKYEYGVDSSIQSTKNKRHYVNSYDWPQ